jgi:glucose-6-phosphate 1-dehydrogenase
MNAKQADVLVPFGATGDLAFKKIHPAIHKLGPSLEKKTMTKAEIDHYQRHLLFLSDALEATYRNWKRKRSDPSAANPAGLCPTCRDIWRSSPVTSTRRR